MLGKCGNDRLNIFVRVEDGALAVRVHFGLKVSDLREGRLSGRIHYFYSALSRCLRIKLRLCHYLQI